MLLVLLFAGSGMFELLYTEIFGVDKRQYRAETFTCALLAQAFVFVVYIIVKLLQGSPLGGRETLIPAVIAIPLAQMIFLMQFDGTTRYISPVEAFMYLPFYLFFLIKSVLFAESIGLGSLHLSMFFDPQMWSYTLVQILCAAAIACMGWLLASWAAERIVRP
ncbi:MAG: hypothetical protein GY948_01035 [Alphaproteobacteria bacterium]|nr:hypothetical protein [Alphaproteobacteria bacterium]